MKTLKFNIILFFLFFCLRVVSFADNKDEILKLARLDLLPQFQENVISKQISSYDATGGNDDGFSGKYSFLREENGNQVIAELDGPGIIHRIWTPTPTDDTIQFYFDGETTPRIERKFIDLFSGDEYPFKRPVVGNEVGGYYCYLPIPYKKSSKIVFKGKMRFIQIQYSETAKEKVDKSFSEKLSEVENSALEKVIKVWQNYDKKILNEVLAENKGLKKFKDSYIIKPGETVPVFQATNGGRICGIEITPDIQLNSEFKELILRARWDDEPVPAINSPFTDFFGYAFGEPSVKSLLLGVRNNIHSCYLPMPFDEKAILELEFLRNPLNKVAEIPVTVTIYYSEKKRAENEGKFYAKWRREKNPEMGKPYRILDAVGRGHYVGTILQAQGLNSGMTWFFESDDKCYIDGELRIHGTGSEDYFNGGWYAVADRWDQGYSLPLHGCLDYSVPMARTGGYRFMLTDKISFEENISLTIEHGPENNNLPVDYTTIAFFYCDTPPVSNNLPPAKMLCQIESPKTLEYWIQVLPIQALSRGVEITNENCKDASTEQDYQVYKLCGNEGNFAKFELAVPGEGKYKLYLSYVKGSECGQFDVNQRQVPVKRGLNGYAPKNTFVEKEYIGELSIKEGTNTITMMMRDHPQHLKSNTFLLHRIYLEKIEF